MRVSESSSSKLKAFVPVIVVLLIVGAGVNALIRSGNNQGYAPDQPIPFSHKRHAGQNNIPCMYCHSGIEKTQHATVPPMNVCMNCHSVVKPDSPWIMKLKEQINEKKEPFQWVKVNNLPDYVHFSHKRHVTKGVACETCHGDIKKMDVVRQEWSLNMGWCLDCHRGVTSPAHLLKNASPSGNPAAGIPPGGIAPTSCNTCHN